jgi:hypothetical protein
MRCPSRTRRPARRRLFCVALRLCFREAAQRAPGPGTYKGYSMTGALNLQCTVQSRPSYGFGTASRLPKQRCAADDPPPPLPPTPLLCTHPRSPASPTPPAHSRNRQPRAILRSAKARRLRRRFSSNAANAWLSSGPTGSLCIGRWLPALGDRRSASCCVACHRSYVVRLYARRTTPPALCGVRLIRAFSAAPTPWPTAAPRPPPHLHQDSACSRTYHCRACVHPLAASRLCALQ